MFKTCSTCKEQRAFIEFAKRSCAKDGLHYICKTCCKMDYQIRKEKLKETKAKWYLKNKQRVIEKTKAWNAAHKEQHDRNTKAWNALRKKEVNQKKRERYANDLNFKLADILRSRVAKGVKRGSAIRQLGCSIEEFKTYLESKFQLGMNWTNWSRDGWHIDHVKPLNSFDLTDPQQFSAAVHYTNLQPLWAKDNFKKGSKI